VDAARPATAADGPVVVDLARRAAAELAANRGGDVWRRREAHAEPLEADLTARCAAPGADDRAVVGTIDGTVVGYGLARLERLHDGERLAVVSDLYVEPEARGVGVGEAMMDLLVAWASDAGAIGIDALALPGDRHTKNFFETFGLTARAILVHRDLRPAGTGA
jgi:ribosomal protein S18 acetylase RimI-like enzyme